MARLTSDRNTEKGERQSVVVSTTLEKDRKNPDS